MACLAALALNGAACRKLNASATPASARLRFPIKHIVTSFFKTISFEQRLNYLLLMSMVIFLIFLPLHASIFYLNTYFYRVRYLLACFYFISTIVINVFTFFNFIRNSKLCNGQITLKNKQIIL